MYALAYSRAMRASTARRRWLLPHPNPMCGAMDHDHDARPPFYHPRSIDRRVDIDGAIGRGRALRGLAFRRWRSRPSSGSYDESNFSYAAAPEDGPSAWATCLMAGISLCLLGSSSYFFVVGVGDTRETSVNAYADLILNWTSHRAELARTNFSVAVAAHAAAPTLLAADESADTFRDEEAGDGLPTYDPLR